VKFVRKRLVLTKDASRGRHSLRDWAKGLASIAIVAGIAYVLLGFASDMAANRISEEREAKLFQWLELGDAAPEHDGFARAKTLFAQLCASEDLRPLPYRLVLVDQAGPNAFALPGGLVAVTPDLLDWIESDIGLAFVLGHELGHHQNRHALKRMGRALIYRMSIGLISGAGDLSVLDHGLSLASLAYSRGQEEAADQFAVQIVHQTFNTLDGAMEFFEDIHENYGVESRAAKLFRSHPLTSDRIAAIQREIEKLPADSPAQLGHAQGF